MESKAAAAGSAAEAAHDSELQMLSGPAARMSGITLLYCYLSFIFCVLSLLPVRVPEASVALTFPAVLLIPGALYLLDAALTVRLRRMNITAAVHILCMAGSAVLFYKNLVLTPDLVAVRILFTALYLISLLVVIYIIFYPVQGKSIHLCFDLMVALLVIWLALQKLELTILPVLVPVLIAFSLALSFLTMIRIRIDRTGSSGASIGNAGAGRAMFGVLIAVIAAIAVLIGTAASGLLHGVSAGIWTGITAIGRGVLFVIRLLYAVLDKFAFWLSAHVQPAEYESAAAGSGYTESAESWTDGASIDVPVWFYAVIAVIAAIAVIAVIYRLRRIRLQKADAMKRAAAASGQDVQRSGGLKQAFAAWLQKQKYRLTVFYLYQKNRRTPAGRLHYYEKRFKRTLPRQTGESGEAYLRRLAADPACEEKEEDLLYLAQQVEQAFYAPGK